MAVEIEGAFASYQVSQFDATYKFYEQVLGCHPVDEWDRPDGRGAYFAIGDAALVEILGAPRGGQPLTPPPPGSFMVVVWVGDLEETRQAVNARSAEVAPVVSEAWGRYFPVRDPDGVEVYFLERVASQ